MIMHIKQECSFANIGMAELLVNVSNGQFMVSLMTGTPLIAVSPRLR